MPSPDRTDAERIEDLLRGMPPETERQAHLEGLVRELRTSVPAAPAGLRSRVRELRPQERKTFGWKPVLVVAPLVIALVGAALLGGRDGGREQDESAASGGGSTQVFGLQPEDSATPTVLEGAQRGALAAPTVAPDATRAQEWDVTLELALRDNARLSEASADAIRTTRELGGFVVSSTVSTEGRNGNARLLVRVPQRRVQEAIALFSDLGTITGQQVSVQDRQGELDRLARRIDTLRIQIAELNAKLAQPGLTEAERLRLELQRRRLQGQLNQRTRQRSSVASEVAMAEFDLTLRTQRAAAVGEKSRFDDAVGDAVGVLAVAAAVAIFLLIVLAPLAVVVLVALLVRRSFRRRGEERLLDRPQPTSR
jgi:Domain of unknown function (DUF4349)